MCYGNRSMMQSCQKMLHGKFPLRGKHVQWQSVAGNHKLNA